MYTFIKINTQWQKVKKIQLIIMDIIQSYYTFSSENNGVEMMFLFDTGLSHLILQSYYSLKSKCWNHQMRGHGYKTKGTKLSADSFKS